MPTTTDWSLVGHLCGTRPVIWMPAGKFHRWISPFKLFRRLKKGHRNLDSPAVPWPVAIEFLEKWVRAVERRERVREDDHMWVTIGNWTFKKRIPQQMAYGRV